VDLIARPLIVVTVAVAARQSDAAIAERKNRRYAESVERHGGRPLLVDATSSEGDRRAAFEAMDGLLLSGGADVDPARFGQPNEGSRDIESDRDELEAAAWAGADARGLPVLGICRGFQAINVFAGGTLLQHVDGHEGPGWGTGRDARIHPIRIDPVTRVGRLLGVAGAVAPTLDVNTYHHQAVRPSDLAPGLVATGWADSPVGEIVEALEAPGERFVVGVQCHPERTEVTPEAFEGVWRAFVEAAREAAAVLSTGPLSSAAGTGRRTASRSRRRSRGS
jgi:gamma-glutamyl-gamma-aminobutyrate hydrolase PuuD